MKTKILTFIFIIILLITNLGNIVLAKNEYDITKEDLKEYFEKQIVEDVDIDYEINMTDEYVSIIAYSPKEQKEVTMKLNFDLDKNEFYVEEEFNSKLDMEEVKNKFISVILFPYYGFDCIIEKNEDLNKEIYKKYLNEKGKAAEGLLVLAFNLALEDGEDDSEFNNLSNSQKIKAILDQEGMDELNQEFDFHINNYEIKDIDDETVLVKHTIKVKTENLDELNNYLERDKDEMDYYIELKVGQECILDIEEEIKGYQYDNSTCIEFDQKNKKIIAKEPGIVRGELYLDYEQEDKRTFMIKIIKEENNNNTNNNNIRNNTVNKNTLNNNKTNKNIVSSNNFTNNRVIIANKTDTSIADKEIPKAGKIINYFIMPLTILIIIKYKKYKNIDVE